MMDDCGVSYVDHDLAYANVISEKIEKVECAVVGCSNLHEIKSKARANSKASSKQITECTNKNEKKAEIDESIK